MTSGASATVDVDVDKCNDSVDVLAGQDIDVDDALRSAAGLSGVVTSPQGRPIEGVGVAETSNFHWPPTTSLQPAMRRWRRRQLL